MEMFNTVKSQNPANYPTGRALYGKSKSTNWTIEPQASYENTILGKGRISVVTGATIRQEFRENVSIFCRRIYERCIDQNVDAGQYLDHHQ